MTTFKAFLRIVKKNIWLVVMYTVILVVTVIGNTQNKNVGTDFSASKPDVVIYNNDHSKVSDLLVDYVSERSSIVELPNTDNALDDAIYYNAVDYVIYIENGFGEKLIHGEKPAIEVKSVGNYSAYLADTFLKRFTGVVSGIAADGKTDDEIVSSAKEILEKEAEAEVASKLDTSAMSKLKTYYIFLNYSILAGLVFIIAYTTASFKRDMTKKRLKVSATSYSSINGKLLLYNFGIAILLMVVFVALAYLLNGGITFSGQGWLMILNATCMSIFATAFALFLTNLLKTNGAILAIVNIVSIGSSFLTGVFVPAEWMPESVVNAGRVLPSYYYVQNNEEISKLEEINFEELKPILTNMLILLGATAVVAVINGLLVRKRES